jgi:hypothetical protein
LGYVVGSPYPGCRVRWPPSNQTASALGHGMRDFGPMSDRGHPSACPETLDLAHPRKEDANSMEESRVN